MYQGGWANENKPPTPNGSNFETGYSARTIASEDVQIPGTLLNKINNKSSEGANIKKIRRVGVGGECK